VPPPGLVEKLTAYRQTPGWIDGVRLEGNALVRQKEQDAMGEGNTAGEGRNGKEKR